MKPSAELLDRLKRDRTRLHMARPSTGFGERRSRKKGAGLEFAESRLFRPGDDLKNLDPRLSMRTGETYIREFFLERRAAVQIVMDASASMMWPDGSKFALAKLMTSLLAFVALISGDDVQIISSSQGSVHLSRWFRGERRSSALFDHVHHLEADAEWPFAAMLDAASGHFKPKAIIFIVGDFLEQQMQVWLADFASQKRELIIVDLIHRKERTPDMRSGAYSLFDAEGMPHLDITIDKALKAAYCDEFESWKRAIKTAAERLGGLYISVPAPFDGNTGALAELVREHLLPVFARSRR